MGCPTRGRTDEPLLRGSAAALLLVAITALYLSRMQPRVWVSGKKLVLLAGLSVAFTGLVVAVSALVGLSSPGWAYLVPSGALGMLAVMRMWVAGALPELALRLRWAFATSVVSFSPRSSSWMREPSTVTLTVKPPPLTVSPDSLTTVSARLPGLADAVCVVKGAAATRADCEQARTRPRTQAAVR